MMVRNLLPLLLLGACLPVPEGRFVCALDEDCPADWTCVAERCYEEAPSDDGGVDAGRDVGDDASQDVGADGSLDASPGDGGVDGGPSDVGIDANEPDVPVLPPRPVDVLFVIDNSATMNEEQQRLRTALPELLTGLALGSTVPGETYEPVRDMHVGVVTTHMDVGPFGRELPTCAVCEQEYGYDGVLTREARQRSTEPGICTTLVPECSTFGERFLTYDGTGASLSRLQRGAECKTRVSTRGCGFEQPLEAALKALAPSERIDFRGGTGGHGDEANTDFLRPDSVLLVVFVTDEEDCSSPSNELFNLDSEVYPNDRLSVRCIENPEAVYPVSRYVTGLLDVHPAEQLVVASLVGVPLDIAGSDPNIVLEDPRMVHDVTPSPVRPASVCTSSTTDSGAAPRFFEVARGLTIEGAGSENESICASTYGPFFSRVLQSVRERVLR